MVVKQIEITHFYIMLYILIALSIIFGYTVPSYSYELRSKIILTEDYNRDYRDIDKKYDGKDDKMCWAASISNMISFALNDDKAQHYFDWFKEHFENKPIPLIKGFASFCEEYNNQTDITECEVFRNLKYRDVQKTPDLRDWIIGSFMRNEILIIGVFNMEFLSSHVVTLYGYEIEDDKFYLYWVDSNDGEKVLYKDHIAPDWYTKAIQFESGVLSGWAILQAVSLPVDIKDSVIDIHKKVRKDN